MNLLKCFYKGFFSGKGNFVCSYHKKVKSMRYRNQYPIISSFINVSLLHILRLHVDVQYRRHFFEPENSKISLSLDSMCQVTF